MAMAKRMGWILLGVLIGITTLGADRNLLQPVDTPFGGHHACYVSAT